MSNDKCSFSGSRLNPEPSVGSPSPPLCSISACSPAALACPLPCPALRRPASLSFPSFPSLCHLSPSPPVHQQHEKLSIPMIIYLILTSKVSDFVLSFRTVC